MTKFKGIMIRANNQKIAPPVNAAIPCLSKAASAQSDEPKLVKGLTADSQGAKGCKTLKTDAANGIKQNQQNAKDCMYGDLLTRDDSSDYADQKKQDAADAAEKNAAEDKDACDH